MEDIRVLVFDLDETLFPEREFVWSGFQAVAHWMLSQYSVSNFFETAWSLFEAGQRQFIFNQTLEALKLRYEHQLIQEMLLIYRSHQPKISLHQDAQWALKHFKSNKYLGLITNGYLTTQKNKVKALGLESYLDKIIYCDQYGPEYWKPSPVPYLKLMEAAGCSGGECMYVGDHPQKDFVGAKHLGWRTVRICREGGEFATLTAAVGYEADVRITSLYALNPQTKVA